MTIKWTISTGFANARHHGEWDVDDDITDEELDQMLQGEINNVINGNWSKVDA